MNFNINNNEEMNPFKPGTQLILDPVGQFYSSIISPEMPGNYTISATLKEPLNPELLQQAVNDLFKRLPFLNGRRIEKELGYVHEILANPPQITPDQGLTPFVDFYNHGEGHVIRIAYGEFHFKVEVIHSIIDGRSTTEITRALLVRYFQLGGMDVESSSVIDLDGVVTTEEGEDAFARFADLSAPEKELQESEKAYHHEGAIPAPIHVNTLHFDLELLKKAAKTYGTTLNGYLLGHLFAVIAEERNAQNSQKPIVAMMPIDCRSFIHSKTLRNFVTAINIQMPETQKFSAMIDGIQKQLKKIDKALVQQEVNQLQGVVETYRETPQVEKKKVMEMIATQYNEYATTTFSNIGLVKLPPSVEAQVESMEFAISQEGRPYSFGCISVGNTLTLTVQASVVSNEIVSKLKERLGNLT